MNGAKSVMHATTMVVMFLLFAFPLSVFSLIYLPVFGQYTINTVLYAGAMLMCWFCGFIANATGKNYWEGCIANMGHITLDTHIAACVEQLQADTQGRITWNRITSKTASDIKNGRDK